MASLHPSVTAQPARSTQAGTGLSTHARRWLRRRRIERIAAVVLPLIVGAAGIGYWQATTSGHRTGSLLIPSFTEFASALGRLLGKGEFWHAAWTSESALLVAFGLAVAIGVPFGLLIGRHRRFDAFISGWVDIGVVTPTAVLMPMIIIIFGPTFWARVSVMFLFALTFVIIPCRTASMTVSDPLLSMARSYGANRIRLWREIIVPACAPGIFVGLRQGLAHAFTGMFLVELTYLAVGLGWIIQEFQTTFETADIFGVCFLIVAEAALLMAALQWVQSRMSGGSHAHR